MVALAWLQKKNLYLSINQNNLELMRQEFKYYISNISILSLRQALSKLMKIDSYADPITKQYTITSLYFDTPFQEDFEEKVDGIKSREKFRIRIYNNNFELIKFESKKRVETVINKVSAKISKEDLMHLSSGDFTPLIQSKNDFLKNSYARLVSSGYKPSVIVEYDREAYFLPYGNIRITFDMNLRTYNNDTNFLDLTSPTMPIFHDNLQILEVKHSIPLPSYIKSVLSKNIASRASISKFVLGQKYTNKSAYRDVIQEPF